jgi:hypothetical protein
MKVRLKPLRKPQTGLQKSLQADKMVIAISPPLFWIFFCRAGVAPSKQPLKICAAAARKGKHWSF